MRLYGLVGKTLSYSFSRKFFTEKFARENLSDCAYQNFELDNIGLLPELVKSQPTLCGLNVTIPFKEAVLPLLAQENEIVQHTGACNCIAIVDGKLKGYNTDVTGFSQSLADHLRPGDAAALVLGKGGASKAVQYALRLLHMPFLVVSRDAAGGVLPYAELTNDVVARHPVIINTTPLGTFPETNACPPIPYDGIGPDHLLFDLVYNPAQTLFLKKGADRGARTANGYEMLVRQALESWNIWTQPSGR